MILLTAVVAGFLITILRARLTGRKLRPIHLESPWLVFVAVIPQVAAFEIPAIGKHIPDLFVPFLLVGSQALLVWFAIVNYRHPGIGVLGVGLAANFFAIAGNGGWMPISPETVHKIIPVLPDQYPLVNRRLGLSKDWIIPEDVMGLPWLADRFTMPGWIPYNAAFSIGDVLIAIGAMMLLWSLSNSEN